MASELQQEHLEDILFTVVNNIPYAIWLKDNEGKYVLVNKEYERFYGVKQENINTQDVMSTLAQKGLTLDDTIEKLKNVDEQIIKNKQTVTEEVLMKFEDEYHYIRITKTPICNKSGEVVGLLGISRDITEEKLATEAEERKRNNELELAREIQLSGLPQVFPPFPEQSLFDIYATMKTAKNVGGDFYDFFYINPYTLAFVVADVSYKGIPAAMFMMKIKSLLRTTALTATVADYIFEKANDLICSDNDKWFFATVAMGVVDLMTGEVTYLNAGHTHPILKTTTTTKTLIPPANIALGMFDNIEFETYKFKLKPGETLFLYTDSVTETTNNLNIPFSETRLLEIIKRQTCEPKRIVKAVSNELDIFVGNKEFEDDVTMLAFTYLGKQNFVKKVLIPTNISTIEQFYKWLEACYHDCNCFINDEQKSKISMVAEEIFSNMTNYANPEKDGKIGKTTSVFFKYYNPTNEIILEFIDAGKRFNPLDSKTPRTDLTPEERAAGGMGIVMVKNFADDAEYEYSHKQNVLTLKFKL